MTYQRMMSPFKTGTVYTSHFKRLPPSIFARHVNVQTLNQIQPALEEQISVCTYRISLKAPRLNSICYPARCIVFADLMIRYPKVYPFLWVILSIWVRSKLCKPTKSPVRQIALLKPLKNFGINFSPSWGNICHKTKCVTRFNKSNLGNSIPVDLTFYPTNPEASHFQTSHPQSISVQQDNQPNVLLL